MRNLDSAFRDELISDDLLDNAKSWMANHLSPEDVFDKKTLTDWAEREMDISWVKKKFSPQDVFDEEQLNEWAEENSFVKGIEIGQ